MVSIFPDGDRRCAKKQSDGHNTLPQLYLQNETVGVYGQTKSVCILFTLACPAQSRQGGTKTGLHQ